MKLENAVDQLTEMVELKRARLAEPERVQDTAPAAVPGGVQAAVPVGAPAVPALAAQARVPIRRGQVMSAAELFMQMKVQGVE